MRRATQLEDSRRDFYLFIDEFQNFTTDAFTSLLAEARKYRLCLTLAHQYVEQLPPEIRRAIFGNVGTLISFRVGQSDAEVLQKEFANTHLAQQFVDLEQFEVIARVLENGANQSAFKGRTLPPSAEYGRPPGKLICILDTDSRPRGERSRQSSTDSVKAARIHGSKNATSEIRTNLKIQSMRSVRQTGKLTVGSYSRCSIAIDWHYLRWDSWLPCYSIIDVWFRLKTSMFRLRTKVPRGNRTPECVRQRKLARQKANQPVILKRHR